MKIISSGIRAGKTHKMITEWFLPKANTVLLVINDAERRRLKQVYRLSKRDLDRVVTFDEAMHEFGSRLQGTSTSTRLLIDNADYLLRRLLHQREIAAISVAGPENVEHSK